MDDKLKNDVQELVDALTMARTYLACTHENLSNAMGGNMETPITKDLLKIDIVLAKFKGASNAG